MSIAEVEILCQKLKAHIKPDLFKIAGGEPTLHPDIDEIIQVIKSSGLASQVRVVSNGLLMHRMTEKFWQQIDQLTISNYISAPVKPNTLQVIQEKCRTYGIVLNIKYVDQFNEIFVEDAFTDATKIQSIYDDCWMRHRCHIVRNGRYYKCTRAAYMDDYLKMLKKETAIEESSYSALDGISLDTPDFQKVLLNFLNDKKPLQSCKYCLGVSGKLRANVQLGKQEVSAFLART